MTHVAVIGAYGSAGVAAAESLAEDAEIDQITMIDGGEPGGLCILRGCMPSKDLLSAAAHRYRARRDDRLKGVPDLDLETVVETKADHVETFASHRESAVRDLADLEGVTLIEDSAEFLDDHTLAVGEQTLAPDYIVLATGSTVDRPEVPGIDSVSTMSSAEVLDATDFPESGIVMGFGYIGIELVPYLSEAAGMDITVIEHDDRPLDRGAPAFGDALLDCYREEFGVEILTTTQEKSVESTESGGVRVAVERNGRTEALEADQLFTFTGRRPALDGLGLENTSLECGPGWVEDTLRARDNPSVFVPGDANGERMLLHMAKEEGYTVADNICAACRGDTLEGYDPTMHAVIFAGAGSYPYATVGLTEDEARAAGFDPFTVTRRASRDGVFDTKDAPLGLGKLVVADAGTVLGWHGFHLDADVMAKTMQVVVETGMDVRAVPDRAYHPTTPEIIDGLVGDAVNLL